MQNKIEIGEASENKLSYLVGVLVGMGLPYFIEEGSPLYKIMNERKKGIILGGTHDSREREV